MDVSALLTKLLGWYDRCGRDLPWRKTKDPYKILVSEMMLQQTQVDRVVLFYRRWLRAFPTWKRLASATNAQVIHGWAGLGYNRRGLMLRDIAMHIVQNGVPQTVNDWKALKGVGVYTAAAVSIFAQGQHIMPIDTNIRRVLGRLFLGIPYPQPKHDERLIKSIEAFLPARRHQDVPQALFDLATDVCKKNPDCSHCPLQRECLAAQKFLSGRVRVPKQMVRKPIEHRHRNKPYPDRIYRGRILKLVREQERVKISEVGHQIDPTYSKKTDEVWVNSMIDRLINEKFLSKNKNSTGLNLALDS